MLCFSFFLHINSPRFSVVTMLIQDQVYGAVMLQVQGEKEGGVEAHCHLTEGVSVAEIHLMSPSPCCVPWHRAASAKRKLCIFWFTQW